MGHVEDRWTRPGQPDKNGRARKEHTDRYGSGKRWLASWVDAGTRRSRSFDTREAAETHLANVTVDMANGQYVAPHDVTVAEFGDRWVRSQLHHRASTSDLLESHWRVHIRPVLGEYRLTDVNTVRMQDAVAQWVAGHHDRAPMAAGSLTVVYGQVASMFKAALRERLIRESPCEGVNRPRVVHERVVPLTSEQVHVIADRITPRLRGMVVLGAASGLRLSELLGVTVDRLSWARGLVTVRVDRQLVSTAPAWGPPKTDRSDRVVVVDQGSADVLRRHIDAYPPHGSGLIFTSRSGGPLSTATAGDAWNKAAAGMGLPVRSGWHMLRHYHASLLIAAGLSVTAVADRLGHKDSTVTLRTYAHLWPNDEDRAVRAIASGLWGVTETATVGRANELLILSEPERSA